MKRRKFIQKTTLSGVGMSLVNYNALFGCNASVSNSQNPEFLRIVRDLLEDWCDGMIKNQIIDPENPKLHGALGCPACDHIHGRCMDAVYPFMYMADKTKDKKFMDAAILVMQWAENNVSHDDGSWTVITNPNSWKGITVFGAIALGEALHYHGHILDESIQIEWTERLKKAARFVYDNFSMSYSNVNYAFTAVHGLQLFGKVLGEQAYTDRSRVLAKETKNYFTSPNYLLYGEAKPVNKKSKKGLPGVDLGYNVEESLNGVVLYALEENDEELLELLEKSLYAHLEFMLPDGAWDNSWGTRHNKWSYWGSRTSDGCQMGYSMMAERNPVFGTAAYKNTVLLKQCTANGLLHGGPHYISHGIKPCIHHTFAHAKPLASILNVGKKIPEISLLHTLPREKEYGAKEFPEIATWLVSKGSWMGTITSYDMLYLKDRPEVQQATGGSLAVLYHRQVGLLFAASMARYIIVEANNQQHYNGEEFALTPRIEVMEKGEWYTNLYDLEAEISQSESANKIRFDVKTQIQTETRQKLSDGASHFQLSYVFSANEVEITAKPTTENTGNGQVALVLPLVSLNHEKVSQPKPERIEITKDGGTVILESNVPLWIKPQEKGRVFNLVPGVEAVPIYARFSQDTINEIRVTIRIE